MTKTEALLVRKMIEILPIYDNGNFYHRTVSERMFRDYCETINDCLSDADKLPLPEK